MGRWMCSRSRILTFLVTFAFLLFTLHQKNCWYFYDQEQKISLEERTFMMKQEEFNIPRDLHAQQRLTAPAFLQMWKDMRTEFVTSFQKLLADGANSTDPRLIKLIQRYIFPPSNSAYKLSYNFPPPAQYKITKDYFQKKGKTRGFFVECGGLDGERSSMTYHLEKDGWQGLLIEADPDYFFQSLGKNRRSWKLNAALCPSANPSVVKFKEVGNSGQGKVTQTGNTPVPCIPLALILKALNRTSIDFLSLDVEGIEMEILRRLPFKDVDIEAINLEYNHNKEKPESFTEFMASVGYTLFKKIDETVLSKRLFTNDLYYLRTKG